MMEKKLSPKALMFIREYQVDMSATQAAIRAGYSPRTAKQQGHRLLSDARVQVLLERQTKSRTDRLEITADRVMLEYARLAFFQPRKLFDEKGQPLPVHQLDDDAAAVIAGLEVAAGEADENGNLHQVIKWRFSSKQAALDSIARTMGMFKDKIEVDGVIDIGATILAARRRAHALGHEADDD